MSSPKEPERTDWLSRAEQDVWFDKFTRRTGASECLGMNFEGFQRLLEATIYSFAARAFNPQALHSDDPARDLKRLRLPIKLESELFRVFVGEDDQSIDRKGFAALCEHWLSKCFIRSSALVVVDVQNDFIDGTLALINGPAGQDGADVVPIINRILKDNEFAAVAYTLDWHPKDHISFYENLHLRKHKPANEPPRQLVDEARAEDNNDAAQAEHGASQNKTTNFKLKRLVSSVKLFDTVLFDEGRVSQKLWPMHCIENSWGAQLHPDLNLVPGSIRIHKGTLSQVDAYSAFWDNMSQNETGLRQELNSRGVEELFICGLAFDFCVGSTALDAIKAGFVSCVIEDACRGIDQADILRRRKELVESGVLITDSRTMSKYLRSLKDCKLINVEGTTKDQVEVASMVRDQFDGGSPKRVDDIVSLRAPGREARNARSPTGTNDNGADGLHGNLGEECELNRIYDGTMLYLNICFKRAVASSSLSNKASP